MPVPPAPPPPPPPPGAFAATVVPDDGATARIGAPIDGQVISVNASVGDQVHAHDLLATIRPAGNVTAGRQPDGGVPDREVRATRDGVLIEVAVASGAEVVRDPRRAMFVVSDLSHVMVEASVPETRFPMVRPGAPVVVRLAPYPDRQFMGRVVRVHPTLDPQTHAGTVSVALENLDLGIRPGMSGWMQMTEAH